MKNFLLIISFALLIGNAFSQSENDIKLALKYFQDKEYEKASNLYEKLFNTTNEDVYFDYYLKCLVEMKKYKEAENTIKKQIKREQYQLNYYISLGELYKLQNDRNKAEESFNEVINKIPNNTAVIDKLANNFIENKEYIFAEKIYIKAQKLIPQQKFNKELANIYLLQNNYTKSAEELVNLLENSDGDIENTKNFIQIILLKNEDSKLKDAFKSDILKKLQKEPEKLIFSDYFIWFLIQEQSFEAALLEAKALDKRTQNGSNHILEIARIAADNELYKISTEAYKYLIDKGKNSEYYLIAKNEYLNALYKSIIENNADLPSIIELETQYTSVINEFGKNRNTFAAIKNLAHIKAFYLNKIDEATKLMEECLNIYGLLASEKAEAKMELADILLFAGDFDEPTLLLTQVEQDNRDNPIGHEAKFRKAHIGYYKGDIEWAKAQLDVIEASTEKLIANDAIWLSLLLYDNTIDDSLQIPVKMFTKAEYLHFQNKNELALQKLDSISFLFPNHQIADEVLFKKAEIYLGNKNYLLASKNLQEIIDRYSNDILADKSIFLLAEINEKYLNNVEKAKELYEKLLLNYKASIYTAEARKRFRILRGEKI